MENKMEKRKNGTGLEKIYWTKVLALRGVKIRQINLVVTNIPFAGKRHPEKTNFKLYT